VSADRLHTIIDADKVLVLRDGEAIEFDHPYMLLTRQDGSMSRLHQEESLRHTEERSQENARENVESRQLGTFRHMVMETGLLVAENLWRMAKESWGHDEKDRQVQQKG
jgi:ABC-type glutathione transport system ATPase component